MSRLKVVIPCRPYAFRHRWKLDRAGTMPAGGTMWDDRCTRCGRWRVDVLDHPPARIPADISFVEVAPSPETPEDGIRRATETPGE